MSDFAVPRRLVRALPTAVKAVTSAALVLAPGGLASCDDDPAYDTSGPVEAFLTDWDRTETIRLGDAYPQEVSRLVIVCPYATGEPIEEALGFEWSGAKKLADRMYFDNEQAVVAAHDGEVVSSEIMSRQLLDLCGDGDVAYPFVLDPATPLDDLIPVPWSDGSQVPTANLG